MAHVDPHARLKNILRSALEGTAFESSRQEGDRVLVLEVRRPEGRPVTVRFLGLKSSESDVEPSAGATLKVRGVAAPGSSLLRLLLPPMLRTPSHSSRVRIDAGSAKLEIVCEDVEWWEDNAPSS